MLQFNGMAVAQAQHALKEMVDKLKANSVKVSYTIFPVAEPIPFHNERFIGGSKCSL